ncbi:MAG TPA: sodium:solute symporter family protein [Bacteroidales bacterium]|nr:sodium:solute symporter family protein [Bacteroidales bacterium]
MVLQPIDWLIIALFFIILLTIGFLASRHAGDNTVNFFLSGRNRPWWLLGVSMVATTFSADTPNLVTDMVRTGGVANNWLWWAFLLTGMLTVFVYARLWNRSKVMTDLEFYELRYSGKPAAFLRGFRAFYLGFFFNVMVIASVSLAFIKIAAVFLGLQPATALVIAAFIVVIYSSVGGLKSILWTDMFQFSFAMFGAVIAAVYVTRSPEIGGLGALFSHPDVSGKLSLFPDISNTEKFLSLFLIPIAVQWWAAWYPGAEPGGGGYVAQRMLSAKNEKHAMGATLLFNFFHYAVRPWPWIIVALASLIIFPDIPAMVKAFPDVPEQFIRNDFAYPAMLREFLPAGLLGLVVASLIAAFMSTVASQLNWGSSYLVNDFYARFVNRNASEAQKIIFARFSTTALMTFSVLLALLLQSALQAFHYLLMIGAGTGLIYILRWFWWRINAWSELSAMIAALVFSTAFILIENLAMHKGPDGTSTLWGATFATSYWNIFKFIGIVLLTTTTWIIVTYATKPVSRELLLQFCEKIKPGGPGWRTVTGSDITSPEGKGWDVPKGILCMIFGCILIYSILFAVGNILYGNLAASLLFIVAAVVSAVLLYRFGVQLIMR